MLEGATYSILEEDEERDVWRIDAFPTTRVGKIDKAALRKRIAEALAAERRDS